MEALILSEIESALSYDVLDLTLAYAAIDHDVSNFGFQSVCRLNDKWLAKWLLFHFDNLKPKNPGSLMADVCGAGGLEVASWLADMSGAEAHIYSIIALNAASAGGHLKILEWLESRFGLHPIDVNKTFVLGLACLGGHVEVADWLFGKFMMVRTDMPGVQTLIDVCAKGHLGAAQWLMRGPAGSGTHRSLVRAFESACKGGSLDVAEWLLSTINLSRDQVVANNTAFVFACGGGHLHVAKWLASEFAIGVSDVRGSDEDDDALAMAARNGHLDIVRWLTQTYYTFFDPIVVGHVLQHANANITIKRWFATEFCGEPRKQT